MREAKQDWRVFLCYRGKTEGFTFQEALYRYLTQTPYSAEKYGGVFLSPRSTRSDSNYLRDIPRIMANVKFFILPLTKNFFDDLWDERAGRPNEQSAPYREIRTALELKECRFICVEFPGYTSDKALIKKLFGKKDPDKDNADLITCAIRQTYDRAQERELMQSIADTVMRSDCELTIADCMARTAPNVRLGSKRDMEDQQDYPFYYLLRDAARLTLLNYASTTLVTGSEIAGGYEQDAPMKHWFEQQMADGEIEISIALTDPHCPAARDAAMYKMYPTSLNVASKDEIILHNVNALYRHMLANPNVRLRVYLTQIALPYAVMHTECAHRQNSYLKVDLYAPVTNDDKRRPSFYLREDDAATESLYSFFRDNVRSVIGEHSFRFSGHPDMSWFRQRNIIHRGLLNGDLLPHTQAAFEACLEEGCPMEVDLLRLADDAIVVGRSDHPMDHYGGGPSLDQLSITDLWDLNETDPSTRILTLRQFLDLAAGRVPILLEIKAPFDEPEARLAGYARQIMDELWRYIAKYTPLFDCGGPTRCLGVAIHSSNPYVLRQIKQLDCLIPCGIISADFSYLGDKADPGFAEHHRQWQFLDVLPPDFVSYRVQDLNSQVVQRVREELRIPLLGWTVKSRREERAAARLCDSLIVEGAKSYL